MTSPLQADTFNIPGKPGEYFAPSGTVNFLTGGEQVDLHKSDLDPISALALEATELAAPMHLVTQSEKLDGSRIEFGEAILEAATHIESQAVTVVNEVAPVMDSVMIAKLSAIIFALRYAQAHSDSVESRRG